MHIFNKYISHSVEMLTSSQYAIIKLLVEYIEYAQQIIQRAKHYTLCLRVCLPVCHRIGKKVKKFIRRFSTFLSEEINSM